MNQINYKEIAGIIKRRIDELKENKYYRYCHQHKNTDGSHKFNSPLYREINSAINELKLFANKLADYFEREDKKCDCVDFTGAVQLDRKICLGTGKPFNKQKFKELCGVN